MGLFGGGEQSSASSSGQAESGIGLFSPRNTISTGSPLIDFGEPMQVAGLVFVIALSYLAWKRFK